MQKEQIKLTQIAKYFLKLGAAGFGGSVALAHTMHKDLVDKRRWLTHEEYKRGLTLSGLIPGPLSAQMAIYIGFVFAGIPGASAAIISFIFPSFLMVVTFAAIYFRFGNIPQLQWALTGISASVIGVLASSSIKLTSKTMKPGRFLWLILFLMFAYTAVIRQTSLILFILAGLVTMVFYSKKRRLVLQKIPISAFILFPGLTSVIVPIGQLFTFFLKAGALAFGGGLAIIPYLHTGVVGTYHWISDKQFLEAIAIAMITPGPVAISATFIGFAVSGILGALIATAAIFFPVYILVIVLTPIFIKHSQNKNLAYFVDGVTAASMGAIAGSIITLGLQTIVNPFTAVLAVAGFAASQFIEVPTVLTVAVAGLLGVAFHSY